MGACTYDRFRDVVGEPRGVEYTHVFRSQAGYIQLLMFRALVGARGRVLGPVLLSLGPSLLNYGPSLLSLGPSLLNYGPVLLNLGPVLHCFWTSHMPHVYTPSGP